MTGTWMPGLGLPRLVVYKADGTPQDLSIWTDAEGTFELVRGQDGTQVSMRIGLTIPFAADSSTLECWQRVAVDDVASTALQPVGAPGGTISLGGGTTLHAGPHTAVYTYVLADGSETLPSPATLFTCDTADAIVFAAVTPLPAHVASVRWYLTPYNSSNRYRIQSNAGAGFTYGLEPAVAAQPPVDQPYPRHFYGFVEDVERRPEGLETAYTLALLGPDVLFDKSSGAFPDDQVFAGATSDATIITELAQTYLAAEIAAGEIDLTGVNPTGYVYDLTIPAGATFREAIAALIAKLQAPAPGAAPQPTRLLGSSTLDPGVWTVGLTWETAAGETLLSPLAQVTINDGAVSAVTLSLPGWYVTAPTVVFAEGAGSGAAATATVLSGAVGVLTLTAPGSGYATPPLVTITGDGTGATAYAEINGGAVVNLVLVTAGSGYTHAAVGFSAGSGAAGTAVLDTGHNGQVAGVTLSNHGHDYTSSPTATFSGGGGSGAAGVGVLTQGVTSTAITNGGSGYSAAPAVAFSGGNGAGAAGTVQISGQVVQSIAVTAGGSGYTSAPSVSISGGGGSGATATAQVSGGHVTGVTITAAGAGYTSLPTIGFSGGGGSGATAAPTLSGGRVTGVTITAGGSGYVNPPLVAFTPGVGGAGALGQVVVDTGGHVTGVTILAGGAGYQTAPTAAFTGVGLGGGATATATILAGAVTAITITNPGHDYTSTPVITIAPPTSGTPATATATLSNIVGSVLLTDGGSGYTSAPTVGFTGGGGTGAAGTAVMSWPLDHVTVTAGGSGYSSPPAVSFEGGGGAGGAAATSTLTGAHSQTIRVPTAPTLPAGVSAYHIYLSDGPDNGVLQQAATTSGTGVILTAPGSGADPPAVPPAIEAPAAFFDWAPDNPAHTAPWQWRLHWLLPSTIPVDSVLLTNDQAESTTPGDYTAHLQGITWRHGGGTYLNRQLVIGQWPNNTPPHETDPPRPYYLYADPAAQAAIGRIVAGKPVVDSSLTTVAACQAHAAALVAADSAPAETLAGVIADVPFINRMPARVQVQSTVLPNLDPARAFAIARATTSLQGGVPQHAYDLGTALLGGHGGGVVGADRVPPDRVTWHRPATGPVLADDPAHTTTLLGQYYDAAYAWVFDDGSEGPLSPVSSFQIAYHHAIGVGALAASTIPPRAVAVNWYNRATPYPGVTPPLLRHSQRTGAAMSQAFWMTALGAGALAPATDDGPDFPTNAYNPATGLVDLVISPLPVAALDVAYYQGAYRVDGGPRHAIPGQWPPSTPLAIPLRGLPPSRGTTHYLEVLVAAVDAHGNVGSESPWRRVALAAPVGPRPPTALHLDVADFPPAGFYYEPGGAVAVIQWTPTPDTSADHYDGEWWLTADPTQKHRFPIPLTYVGQTLDHLFHDGNSTLHTYQFHMRAVNGYGDPGPWSDDPDQEAPFTFCPPPEAPPPPINFTVAAQGFDAHGPYVDLTWDPPPGYSPSAYGLIVLPFVGEDPLYYNPALPPTTPQPLRLNAAAGAAWQRTEHYAARLYSVGHAGDAGTATADIADIDIGQESPDPSDPAGKAGIQAGAGIIVVTWPDDPPWALTVGVDWYAHGSPTRLGSLWHPVGSRQITIHNLTPRKRYDVHRWCRTQDGTTVYEAALVLDLTIPALPGPLPISGDITPDSAIAGWTESNTTRVTLDPTVAYKTPAAVKFTPAASGTETLTSDPILVQPGQLVSTQLYYLVGATPLANVQAEWHWYDDPAPASGSEIGSPNIDILDPTVTDWEEYFVSRSAVSSALSLVFILAATATGTPGQLHVDAPHPPAAVGPLVGQSDTGVGVTGLTESGMGVLANGGASGIGARMKSGTGYAAYASSEENVAFYAKHPNNTNTEPLYQAEQESEDSTAPAYDYKDASGGHWYMDRHGAWHSYGYYSQDGTPGASATTGGATFKNGLYTGGTITTPPATQAVRVYNSTNITIPTSTPTVVTFDSERSDATGMHNDIVQTSRLTALVAGWYIIIGHVKWGAAGHGATGSRSAAIMAIGSDVIASQQGELSTDIELDQSVSTTYYLAVDDYVELVVYQDSGNDVDVLSAPAWSPEFGMIKVAD